MGKILVVNINNGKKEIIPWNQEKNLRTLISMNPLKGQDEFTFVLLAGGSELGVNDDEKQCATLTYTKSKLSFYVVYVAQDH